MMPPVAIVVSFFPATVRPFQRNNVVPAFVAGKKRIYSRYPMLMKQ